MSLQMLISSLGKNPAELVEKMNIDADAILVNQGSPYAYEEWEYRGHNIKALSMQEKGVGLSRTTALQRATGDIVLFADEDIVYRDGYVQQVMQAFADHPEADMLLFNVQVEENRRTYWTDSFHKVHWWNCGRYPAYSFALRREKMHALNITYHLWFGGGARYSCGEDSLFINECIKKGMKVYAVPVCIGQEMPREGQEQSTWFHGYDAKFFYDRGVLYHHLYGRLAPVMAFRFLWKNRQEMCQEISFADARVLMKKGYRGEQAPY